MIKVMSIFGTRPEAIKMAPVVKALERAEGIESVVCVTAQHREMLDQVLTLFDIQPDHDLNIMKSGQSLSEITARVLLGLEAVMKEEKPDLVLVHGDTSTTFSAALAAFYNGIKVGHVEAGLRSYDKLSPFPEEINRSLVGRLADLHFAPTQGNYKNLISEHIKKEAICITGNTVIDALYDVIEETYTFEQDVLNHIDYANRRVIFMTAHRRENLGEPMENIFSAVRHIVDHNEDVEVVFPMHLNPKVREVAYKHLEGHNRIHLIDPLEYKPSANLMKRCYLILTDSGGIQEEGPSLGKPVVVLRRETERPEAVEAGTVRMAGVDRNRIIDIVQTLLSDYSAYEAMAGAVNPYGDGTASEQIVQAIQRFFDGM
ncbi:MAG: UDP-N-acetylglucosamine 2-epimerase (non-hydrolyzing) [Clostridia bacterium]|nr:UDP-N-acetylglucosamine 2-epimerase (non-hydrolyzing) [Clostridia bacterium]